MIVDRTSYQGETIGIELPVTVELAVTETEPGFAGDTASGARKGATLETGLVVQVPLFIDGRRHPSHRHPDRRVRHPRLTRAPRRSRPDPTRASHPMTEAPAGPAGVRLRILDRRGCHAGDPRGAPGGGRPRATSGCEGEVGRVSIVERRPRVLHAHRRSRRARLRLVPARAGSLAVRAADRTAGRRPRPDRHVRARAVASSSTSTPSSPPGSASCALRLEALKRALAAEGLFEAARKRPIPSGRRGSPSSRARPEPLARRADRRRDAGGRSCELVLVPCLVQGDGAPASHRRGVPAASRVCRWPTRGPTSSSSRAAAARWRTSWRSTTRRSSAPSPAATSPSWWAWATRSTTRSRTSPRTGGRRRPPPPPSSSSRTGSRCPRPSARRAPVSTAGGRPPTTRAPPPSRGSDGHSSASARSRSSTAPANARASSSTVRRAAVRAALERRSAATGAALVPLAAIVATPRRTCARVARDRRGRPRRARPAGDARARLRDRPSRGRRTGAPGRGGRRARDRPLDPRRPGRARGDGHARRPRAVAGWRGRPPRRDRHVVTLVAFLIVVAVVAAVGLALGIIAAPFLTRAFDRLEDGRAEEEAPRDEPPG